MAQQLSQLKTSSTRFNPQHEKVRINFYAAEDGYASLVVFDHAGAWLLSLGETRINAGLNSLDWPGQGTDGTAVPDGIYRLELFGYDLARHPGPTAAPRATVEVRNSRQSPGGNDLAVILRQFLPWGDEILRATPIG